MRTLTRKLGVAALAELLPPQPALAHWLPQLAAVAGHARSTDRVLLHGEILTVLEQVGLNHHLVVVIEDLHWADDRSRDLLMFLLTNLADGDVFVAGTYRPAPLRPLTAELNRTPGITMIQPSPLTRHETGRLLASLLGREPGQDLTGRIYTRSGGNPLFIEALSQSADTPADLAELLLGFQNGLSPDAKSVLAHACVIGSPIRHELLAAAAGLPPDTLVAALRELVERQLLRTDGTGYEFRHVLLRMAIYDDLLAAERVRLHAKLAACLTAAEYPAELAYHCMAAGDLPQALTASWRAAAIAGQAGAHAERLRQLQRVRSLWGNDSGQLLGTAILDVLEGIVEAATRCGAIEDGLDAAAAALDLVDPITEPVRAAKLYQHRAGLGSRTGTGPGEDLDRALALVPSETALGIRGELLAQRAATRVFAGDAAQAAQDARAAIEIACQLSDSGLAARSHSYLGLALAADPVAAAQQFALAHEAAGKSGEPHTLLDVATWESAVLVNLGQLRSAITAIQQALRTAQATFRFAELAPILLVKWTQALAGLGRWDEALALVDDAQMEQLPPLSRSAIRLCHAEIALSKGDIATAAAQLYEAEQLLAEGHWAQQYRLRLRIVQGELALAQGLDAAPLLADVDPSAHPHETWQLIALAARVPGAPEGLLALAETLTPQTDAAAAYRAVYRAETSASADLWAAAALAWHTLERPYEAAQSHLEAAKIHAAQGNRPAAEHALREVLHLSVPLKAAPLITSAGEVARRARIHLRQSNVDEPSSADGEFGLTARETEVLHLIAKGMSNRQIATELFISVNTAGVHVSRILTKLSVATRTEAAAFAHTHDIA